ncbi:MAG: hypothetical protein KBH93_00360 [Anaerolineae bacterium]|nr:hypothetical protein [Anaerolineae bacterium]
MNGREVFEAICAGGKPDRLPVQGLWPWAQTLARWRTEGLEPGQDPHEVLGLVADDVLPLPLDLTMVPRFPIQELEKDEHYATVVDEFGVTKRLLRQDYDATRGAMAEAGLTSSMALWLDFPVRDEQSWKELCEERFQPTLRDRVPPDWHVHKNAFAHLAETRWVNYFCFPLFGLFGPLRQLMGFEPLLYAMAGDNPALIDVILSDLTDFWLEVFAQMLDDVRLDEVTFFEDMASSRGPLIGPAMFQRFLAPAYRKIIGSLRDMGVRYFAIDSDGDLRPLLPDLMATGITGVGPVEVTAGMDVRCLRAEYPTLILNGGIDKRAMARGPEAIDAELARYFAVAWEQGRCTPRVDHSAPPDVSWSNAQHFARRYLEYCRAVPTLPAGERPWTGFLVQRLGSFYGSAG